MSGSDRTPGLSAGAAAAMRLPSAMREALRPTAPATPPPASVPPTDPPSAPTPRYAPDVASVRSLRACWLTRLPAPCTLACEAVDARGDVQSFWVTTSRLHYQTAQQAFYPVLDGHAWQCLTDAAERQSTALALAQWLVPGLPLGLAPTFLITGSIYDLLGMYERRGRSIKGLTDAHRVTVGGVLDYFDARLVSVDPCHGSCLPRRDGAF